MNAWQSLPVCDGESMPGDSTPKISGTLSLPQFTPGMVHGADCKVEFDDGRIWSVHGDTKTKLATVFDEARQTVGWLEPAGKGVREVVLPGGGRPGMSFQEKLFSRRVW